MVVETLTVEAPPLVVQVVVVKLVLHVDEHAYDDVDADAFQYVNKMEHLEHLEQHLQPLLMTMYDLVTLRIGYLIHDVTYPLDL